MSLAKTRQALETALAAMSPGIALAWENRPYTPTPGTPYARVHMLAAEPDNPEIGGLITDRGFMQITLCYPLGTGPGAALAQAEVIRATFPRGASFTASGVTTQIERTPEIGPAMIEDDVYALPVRVRFYAHHQ